MLKWKRLLLALAESEAQRTQNTVKNFVFLCRVSASEKRRVVRVHVCVSEGVVEKRNRPLHAPPVLQGSPSISIRFMLSFAMPRWPLALWLLNQLAHHGGGYTGVIHTHSHMFAHINGHMRARTHELQQRQRRGEPKSPQNAALSQKYPTKGKLTIFCQLIISLEKASQEI